MNAHLLDQDINQIYTTIMESLSRETMVSTHSAKQAEKDAEQNLERIRELPLVKEILNHIGRELADRYPNLAEQFPDVLPYHGKLHADDVMHEAMLFAATDNSLTDREIDLLGIAAAFHDAGFIKQYEENEPIGANMAVEAMTKEGSFAKKEITRVANAILGTQVDFEDGFIQKAVEFDDRIAKLLADADVSNFGRSDIGKKSKAVFQELLAHGTIAEDTAKTRRQFDVFRMQMLKKHNWHTDAAHALREKQKQKNIKQLQETMGP